MAQTREHTAILQLTGKPTLTVALTKTDRVAAAVVAEVQAEVEQTRASWALTPSLSFPPRRRKTSVLRNCAAICCSLRSAPARSSSGFAALDRAFTVKGAGLVVTGTALSGEVRVGDTLWLTGVNTPMRVRGPACPESSG